MNTTKMMGFYRTSGNVGCLAGVRVHKEKNGNFRDINDFLNRSWVYISWE